MLTRTKSILIRNKGTPVKTLLQSGLLALLLISRMAAAEPSAAPPSLFKDHGLRRGSLPNVLPQNAIAHLQINRPQHLLESFEKLVVATVPEKLLPPPLQGLVSQEHPVLTALGMSSLQAPLTADQIAQKIGLDTDEPASLTVYPGLPPKSFVLSVPIKNHAAFEAFLLGIFRPSKAEARVLGDKSFVRLELKSPQLRELFVACSADRVFLTGDQALLFLLYPDNNFPRLRDNAHWARIADQTAREDVWITLDPSLLKPFLTQIEFFEYLPLQLLSQYRPQLLAKIPGPQRQMIEQRLRLEYGIRDLDQFADYVECLLTATYEELFDCVLSNLKSFNGVTAAVQFDAAFPKATLYLHSDQFQSRGSTQAIPLEAVRAALGRVPGRHSHVTVTWRAPAIEPSARFASWLKRVRGGFQAKHLNLTLVEAAEKIQRDTIHPQPIAAQVPWMITTRAAVNPLGSPADRDSLKAYFVDFTSLLSYPATRVVTIVPNQANPLLENSLRSEQGALAHNNELVQKTFSGESSLQNFIQTVYRLNQRGLDRDVSELTWETALVTRGGLFGFNQHELVNRRIYYSRNVGDYTLFHQASRNARWISNLEIRSENRLSPGLDKLLSRVPTGANYICVNRPLADLPGVLEWVRDIEELVHRDAGSYLSKARRSAEGTTNQAELARKLQSIPFSPVISSVNRDAQSGEVYCLLPGNIAFPRPKVAPAALKLFADFNRSADEVGGCLFYTRVADGTAETSFVSSTEGLSRLIKTVGNAAYDQYLDDPAKMAELQNLFVTERDKNSKRMDEIIMRNPAWEFLGQIQIGGRPAQPKTQTDARPHHPIAPRTAETPVNLIDLSKHYNAALNDSWHTGGISGNDLSSVPQGVQEFAGVKFDVRGLVQLSGKSAAEQLSVRFPKEVKNIRMGRACRQLHLLQAAGWPSPVGTQIGSYVVHYQDGTTEQIPIIYGKHVRDWWSQRTDPAVTDSEVAWKGTNAASKSSNTTLELYKTTWKNPRPDAVIESLDYISAMTPSAPFLLALTAE